MPFCVRRGNNDNTFPYFALYIDDEYLEEEEEKEEEVDARSPCSVLKKKGEEGRGLKSQRDNVTRYVCVCVCARYIISMEKQSVALIFIEKKRKGENGEGEEECVVSFQREGALLSNVARDTLFHFNQVV